MHSDSLSLNLQSQYSINELIFINSGSNYYVRLPINQSAALFASNNEGKTSSLSALKLFLLPEVNFKGSANKFNFSSGGVTFSDEASFRYYFPSHESYIICEAENPSHPHGFCWVLFKSTRYHYDRIAVPHPYKDIEHLFWNTTSNHNEEIGALHEDIAITTIKEKLLSKQYGGLLITDKKMISEAIYSRTTAKDDHTRFCLLPMIQKSSSDSVKTVRALLDMAFDLSNASTQSLPIAIGSIIDSRGPSVVKEDGIFLDLEDKLAEWQDLQEQQIFLSLIEEKMPQWDQFKVNLDRYTSKKSHTKVLFNEITHYVNDALNLFVQEAKSLKEQANQQEKTLNIENQKLRQIENSITVVSTRIEETEVNAQKIDQTLNDLEGLKADYAQKNIFSAEEIINDLKQRELSNQEYIEALENSAKTESRLISLDKEISQKRQQLSTLKSSLASIQNRENFLDQFTEDTSSILFSLNENFTSLTALLTANEQQTITDFANLFGQQDGKLTLNDHPFSKVLFKRYSDENAILNLANEIKDLQSNIGLLEKDRSSLLQYRKASPQDRQQNRSQLIKDNKLIQSQLANLAGEVNLRKSLKELQDKRDTNQSELSIYRESQNALQAEINVLIDQFNHSKSAYHQHQEQLSSIQRIADELKVLTLTYRGFLDSTGLSSATATLKSINDYKSQYVESTIEKIQHNIHSINELNNVILRSLHIFTDYGFIEISPEEKHRVSLSSQSFQILYESLKNRFETLESQKKNFHDRLEAHNNTVATSIRIISTTKELIDSYINGLNRQLSSYQISNLERVAIDLVYHPQYRAAVDAMRKMSKTQYSTYPKELYDYLQSFHNTFYVKSSKKIDIAKIIEKVNYSFYRNEEKEDTPQSNGTNSMVNAILLAILFKNMIPEDLKLQLPVVFDEVGKLDEDNLNEIYKIVTDQNLTLFAATPEQTGTIASVLDLYHDLSCCQATDVTVYGKAKTIYFPGMEERLINLG